MSGSLKRNVIRQRPRLLYAGINNTGVGYVNLKRPAENAELVFISRGSGKTEIGEDSYPFTAGDLIIFNRGCSHREYLDDVSEREIIFIGIGNLRLYGQSPDTVIPEKDFCIVHTDSYCDTVRTYMSQLVAETEGNQPLHEAIAEHLLKILLLFAVRLAAFDEGETFNENTGYIAAKKYFDEHFLEIDNLENVCKSLYINKYYLSHLFTQKAGVPPIKYLINKRLEYACNYLETTDLNVAEVGKLSGYADPCYFSRIFKRVKGVTPLRYRYLFKLDKAEKEKEEKSKNNP